MPDNVKYYFIGLVIALLLLGIFILLLAALYSRKQEKNKHERLKMQLKFQEELLKSQVEIQEQTLQTISQEIHDNIGQVLSLAKLHLGTFGTIADQQVQTKLNETKDLVSKAIRDLRDLSKSLQGDRVTELGLIMSVSNELKLLENTNQFTTQLTIKGNSYRLEPQKEIVLFRIVQEAMNNTIKHSKAQQVNVELCYEPNLLRLSITDDGSGFDPGTSEGGIGLKSMAKRTQLINGNFEIKSAPGEGCRILITIKP